MARIGILDFVKRQTPQSRFNHFNQSWESLITLIESQWAHRQVSPHHSGVLIVPMPTSALPHFWSSIVPLNEESRLRAEFSPRVAGEAPFIQVEVLGGQKVQAQRADIILYSHDTLAQDGDAPSTREADYYVVSINAYATAETEPISPMTMARNFLGLKGGTRPETPYSAEEFAHAILYWSHHARLGEP
ncbi:DUF3228 family protein [Vampirovibrio sp.]|uniref:DUF3228 family protein n=1 Tax=Vampirovibrio sp. TaxID=2717857 RepID=UPI003593954A